MNIIKTAFVDNTLKTHTIHNKVLHYTNESTENKVEHIIGTLNKLLYVL